jgi:hypothetical protein
MFRDPGRGEEGKEHPFEFTPRCIYTVPKYTKSTEPVEKRKWTGKGREGRV